MKCFYHHEKDAVGTCRSCDKGLCPDCAVDLTYGLACRGRCEDAVRKLIALRQESLNAREVGERALLANRSSRRTTAAFGAVLGALLLTFGLLQQQSAFL